MGYLVYNSILINLILNYMATEYLTKEEYLKRTGIDPTTIGLKPVQKPPTQTGGVSGTQSFQKTGNIDEDLKVLRNQNQNQNQPFQKTGNIEEDLKTLRNQNQVSTPNISNFESGTPNISDFEPEKEYKTAKAALTEKNVKKGEGSGVDGKRTFGETLGNIARTVRDVRWGIGRAAVRMPVNIAQTLTPNAMWNENSLLRGDSDRSQAFDERMKGQSTAQKIGATAFDVGTLFAPTGAMGAVGSAGKAAGMAIPGVAKAAKGVGTLGKLARAVPRVTGALAEGTMTNAMLGGDVGDGAGLDIGIGILSPVAARAFKAVGKLIGSSTKLSRAGEYAADIEKRIAQGDLFAKGEYDTTMKGLEDVYTDVLNAIPEGTRKEKSILNWLIKNVGEGKKLGPSDDPVREIAKILSKNGGVDGVSKEGKFLTKNARELNDTNTKTVGKALEDIFKFSNSKVLGSTASELIATKKVRAEDINSLKGLMNSKGTVVEDLVKKFVGGKEMSGSELFELSKAIRNRAYNEASGLLKNTERADGLRNMAKIIDDKLLTLKDVDPAMVKELRDTYALGKDMDRVYEVLSKTKAPEILNPSLIGKVIGGLAAFSTRGIGSFVAAHFGNFYGNAFTKGLNRLNMNKVNPEWFRQLQKSKNMDEVIDLMKRTEEVNLKNVSTKADDLASKAKVKADKAKADELSRKYQEYIQSKKEPVQYGPQTPNDLYDTNYIPENELPTIKFEKNGSVPDWVKEQRKQPYVDIDSGNIITPKQSKAILKEQKLRNFI